VYFFGLYHWRARFKRLWKALALAAVSLVVVRSSSRWRRGAGILGLGWALHRGASALNALLTPAPWVVEAYKYEALARALPTEGADSWFDVGCGTGRSVVGVSDLVPEGCRVVGLDVFDDRVVLGNGPGLAARNARQAGLETAMVRGDGTRLPVASDSQDVATACRLLHDLSRSGAETTLSELHRVCAPGGAVGLLEIPITHDGHSGEPAAYWESLVADAGFAVETVEKVPRRRSDDSYVVVVGRA